MPRRYAPILLIIAMASAATGIAVYVMTFHPPLARYPVRGIDVSHHQGTIDWPTVAADGVRFAWIKATEGGDHLDTRFAENRLGARAAGIPWGAYHFFTLCRPGRDQAEHFIRTVPRDDAMLPPAVDLEFTGNCTDPDRMLDPPKELGIYLDRIERHYGRKAVLYVRRDFYDAHLAGGKFDHPLWLQSFILRPDYAGRPWTFWQYHAFGSAMGIEGPVDRNVFHGTEAEFERWLREATVDP